VTVKQTACTHIHGILAPYHGNSNPEGGWQFGKETSKSEPYMESRHNSLRQQPRQLFGLGVTESQMAVFFSSFEFVRVKILTVMRSAALFGQSRDDHRSNLR
jgi:hypothetical protein